MQEGASSSESASSEDENDDGEEGESASGDEIAQLAKQLGSSEHSIPISEQLQVMYILIIYILNNHYSLPCREDFRDNKLNDFLT